MNESPETVLRVAGEGGGYTIVGVPDTNGVWKLRAVVSDSTPALINGNAIHRKGEWVVTLADALAQINPQWFRLHPLEIHPQFQVAVFAEVANGMLALRDEHGSLHRHAARVLAEWQRMCGIGTDHQRRD